MMTNIKAYIILGLALLTVSGCAVTDFDRSADFTQYKTYTWGDAEVDVDNPVYDSDLIEKRVRRTVEQEFAKRGIIKDERSPDFVIEYHTYTEEKARSSYNYPYGYRFMPFGFYPFAFGWGGYPYGWMGPRESTTEYTEGTLILDIIDVKTDELLWRGSVSGDVEDTSRLRKKLEKGIRAIMKKYPVTPDEPLIVSPDVIS